MIEKSSKTKPSPRQIKTLEDTICNGRLSTATRRNAAKRLKKLFLGEKARLTRELAKSKSA